MTNDSMYQYSVFISYRHEGDRVAKKLYEKLNRIAVSRSLLKKNPVEKFASAGKYTLRRCPAKKPFLDEECFHSGFITPEVSRAIRSSKMFALVGSENMTEQSYVNKEVCFWCGLPCAEGDEQLTQKEVFESIDKSLLDDEKASEIQSKFQRIIPIVDCGQNDVSLDKADKCLPWAYQAIRNKLHEAQRINAEDLYYKPFIKHHTELARYVVASLLGCDKHDVDKSIRRRRACLCVLIALIIAVGIMLVNWINIPPVEVSAEGVQWNGSVVPAGDSMSFELVCQNGINSRTLVPEDFICEGFQPHITVNDSSITFLTETDYDIELQNCTVYLKSGRYHSAAKFKLLRKVNPKTVLFCFTFVNTKNEILTDICGGFDRIQSGQSTDYTITFSSAVPLTRSPDFEEFIILEGFQADVAVTWGQTEDDIDFHYAYDKKHRETLQCHILFHNVQRTEEREAAFFYVKRGAVYTDVGTLSPDVYDTNRDGTQREMRIVDYSISDLTVPTPILKSWAEKEVPLGGAFLTTLTFSDMFTGEMVQTRENTLQIDDLSCIGFEADQVDIRELTGGGYWILFSGVQPKAVNDIDRTMSLYVKSGITTSPNGRPNEYGKVVLDFEFVSSLSSDRSPTASLTALTDSACGQKTELHLIIEDDHTLPMISSDDIQSVCTMTKDDRQVFNAITVQEDGGWDEKTRIFILSFYGDDIDTNTEFVIRFNHEAGKMLTDSTGNPISEVEYRSVFHDFSAQTKPYKTDGKKTEADSNKTLTSFVFDFDEKTTIANEGSMRFRMRYLGEETLNVNWKYHGNMLSGERFSFDYTIVEGTKRNEFWITLSNVKNTTGADGNKYLLLNRAVFSGWIDPIDEYESEWIVSPPLHVEPDPTLLDVIVRINGKVIEENTVEIDHEDKTITPIHVKQGDEIVVEASSKQEGAVCQIKYKIGQGKAVEKEGDIVRIPVPNEYRRFSLQVYGRDEHENRHYSEWQYYMIDVELPDSETAKF